MRSDWPVVRLGDHCVKIGSGATPKGGKEAYLEVGVYRLIRSQNVYNDGFAWPGLAFISEEQARRLDGVAVAAGDVLVNITGDSVARVCTVPAAALPARVNQHVAIVRPRPTSFDANYLRWFLCAPEQQERLLGLASAGATRNALTKGMLEALHIPMPPVQVQRELAAPFVAMEQRIDLLRQTNTTLEAIAQALFKSWFIDFDPVRAKAEGREPDGMDAATAALFPAEFEESALGQMPKGWSTCRLGDLCTRMVNGGTPSRNKPEFWENGDIPWFKTGELFDAHLMHPSEYITERGVEGSSVKVLPRHSVLMAIYAAPTVGRLGVLTSPAAFNQACTGMVADESVGPWFLLQTLFHGRAWFNSRANGAAQQNISKQIVESYQCVRPSRGVLAAFNDVASHIYSSAERNSVQAQVLGELRDALLPRLVSGKIRLHEAQELVGAV